MTGKQSGLSARFIVGGYDLSGDISALDSISGGVALLDVTDITQSAHSRITGQRDGSMGFSVYMDTSNAHPVLSALPSSDTLMTFLVPPLAIGSVSANLNAKQVGYDPTRNADGSLMMKVQGQGNEYGLEWCEQITPGLRSDTGATNGATQDDGGGFATPSFPATTVPVTNTSPLPATVVISGGTVGTVTINGASAGSGDGTYTVPPGQTIAVTYTGSPSWTWTLQTAYGAQAYLSVTAFTGTSVTVAVQDSADGSTWAAVTGLTFTAATAAPYTQRLATANNATLRRYVRAVTTGTFSAATFTAGINRNMAQGAAF